MPLTPLITPTDDIAAAHAYRGRPLPSRASVFDLIVKFSSTRPDLPAVTAADGPDQSTYTYGALASAIDRIAGWARDRHGLRPGHVVSLRLTNDLASVTSVLGLLRTGAALLILDAEVPPERARAQESAVGAVLAFYPTGQDTSAGASSRIPLAADLPDPEGAAADLGDIPRGAAPALIFGTSGSTAMAKLVVQSHANLAMNAAALRLHHGLGPGRSVLGCLPVHHVNGMHFTIMGPLFAGAHAILSRGFDPLGYPRLLAEFRPTIASVVPSILESLRYLWRDQEPPVEFRYFTSAAAPLSRDTLRAAQAVLRRPVLQGYGLTETTNFSTTMPADVAPEVSARLAEEPVPSVGVALYGNEVTLLDPAGRPVPPGQAGEVCMRGFNVMSGYARNDAANAHAFRGGWFHSEDIGRFVAGADGRQFLVLTGRIKNIAKVGGVSVSLEEMERTLCAHPSVSDAACVVTRHPMHGERIVAAVVAAGPVTDRELADHLRVFFPVAVLPQRTEHVPAIPRSLTGKIQRQVLQEQLGIAAN
jgi:long-chain acyl-CoA synthetase